MGETTFTQVEAIFHEAVQRAPEQRRRFLDKTCHGNERVRRQVEDLLALDDKDAGLLDTAPWKRQRRAPEPVDPLAQPGSRVGRYRLLERLGTGGMGTVWLAERADRQFRRRVALKLIKRGMDTDDILRRFRNERQVLAGLQHPNIAQLLDGDATADGRPYLVMEYVDGRPIDAYCDEQDLALRERLELFMRVCRAVQVAHRNLVIHRDLKPSNILVNGDGEPKLLDFGIAKVMTDDRAAITATALRVMTPLYASPEQIRGDRITTASDVYALGVLLYGLVAGRSPYELASEARSEIERAVLFQEPRRPSTSAGKATASGDVDTIVLKALAKEPERRYGSPEQLADDLRRYLDGLPILARSAGVGTRIVKALRRNRGLVVASIAGGAVSLLVAIALSVYLFIVPAWVQVHLDAARLELLDPHQTNNIYLAVYRHDAAQGIGAPQNGLEAAIAQYDKALRLYPMRGDIRQERDVVRLAAGEETDLDPAALDDRARGLLAMLTGDIETAVEAWSRLDLVAEPDPVVEGMLGVLYLATDEPARAYPRLTSAHRMLPEAGFLCASLAEAAARCGDTDLALDLIERARSLPRLDEGLSGMIRIEADALAAAGRYDEAAAKYEQIIPWGNLVSTLHYAEMLEALNRPREALTLLATAVGRVHWWAKVNRSFVERAERWWAGLTDAQRADLLAARRADDPLDPESFSALLFACQVATLALEQAGPPVDLTGRPARPAAPMAAVAPRLAEVAATIPVADLKGWVRSLHPISDGDELSARIVADLTGPRRSLSPETRAELLAWEHETSQRRVGRLFGFTDD